MQKSIEWLVLFGLTLTLLPRRKPGRVARFSGRQHQWQIRRRDGRRGDYRHQRVRQHQHPRQSDDTGAYTTVNLIPGIYSIGASRSGFRPVVFRNFVLRVGQSARLDITMDVENIDQTVEVAATVPLLQTENAFGRPGDCAGSGQ